MNKTQPQTVLVAPFLYPKECIGRIADRVTLPPETLRVLAHIKTVGRTTIPAIVESMGITKWMANRTTDRLIQHAMLKVIDVPAVLHMPRRYFEVTV
jgi:hypothetical protein